MNEKDSEHDDDIPPQDDTNPPEENPMRPDIESASQLTGPNDESGIDRHHWIDRSEIDELRSRWTSIQAQFVDQPCTAIEQGDALLAETIEKLQEKLAALHSGLRDRWYDVPESSTEDLRLILQEYRSFLYRLLD